ncbi:MAG: EpsI family protein [Verrucomicrobia bacterium]|nr:EpsI family protein [Verrucomicrobiota bacterium]
MTAFSRRSLILALLTAGAAALCRFSPEITMGNGLGVVMELPVTLPGFFAKPCNPDPVEKKILPADTQFAKAIYYSNVQSAALQDVIHCEIVLSGAERRSIHRPEICLQGQGWTILDSSTRKLPMGQGRELSVRDLYISKDIILKDGNRRPLRAHYFYWFIGQNVTTSSHARRIWLTLQDNIMRGVNHRWAYATVLALVTENFTTAEIGERARSNEMTVALMKKFTQDVAARFQKSFMDSPGVTAAN